MATEVTTGVAVEDKAVVEDRVVVEDKAVVNQSISLYYYHILYI